MYPRKPMPKSKFAFALKAQEPPTRPTLDDSRRPLNVSELAALIGWTRSKIDRYVKAGYIPCHQIGKSCKFYFLGEVLAALNAPNATTETQASAADN